MRANSDTLAAPAGVLTAADSLALVVGGRGAAGVGFRVGGLGGGGRGGSFLVWKDEAFGLWESQWGALYPKGSPSAGVIDAIVSSYYLVTVVDNDYVAGDLFQLLITATDVRPPPRPKSAPAPK